jgi:hypothetical protein
MGLSLNTIYNTEMVTQNIQWLKDKDDICCMCDSSN